MSNTIFRTVKALSAPQTGAPLSAAVQVGHALYLSGMVPLDKHSNRLVAGEIKEQTDTVFQHIKNVLEESGSALEKIATVKIFLDDISDGPVVNEIYQKYLKPPYPARCMMQVAKLPYGAKIEVEVMAIIGEQCRL